MKTIGIVTVARSDFGIYLPILKKMRLSKQLKPLIYVTGMHLLPEFGDTYQEILESGFEIEAKIPSFQKDTSPKSLVSAMGNILIGFSNIFAKKKPDMLLVLGDRYEMHSSAAAAVPFNIPIAHLHGGEVTYGAIDELFRHSITKLSNIHFTSTETYSKRIEQMGESKENIYTVGAPGLDNFQTINFMEESQVRSDLGVSPNKPIIISTFHPVTTDSQNTNLHINNLLNALKKLKDTEIIITYPNSDTSGELIIKKIDDCVQQNPNMQTYKNLGHEMYFNLMNIASVMVGNSSSGIIEAPSFKLPVVNIGDRQQGRLQAENVINSSYEEKDIFNSIQEALSLEFSQKLQGLKNPYGDGNASDKIIKTLEQVNACDLYKKYFIDLI